METGAELIIEKSPIEHARMLLPRLIERREKCVQIRQVCPETCRELHEAGLFRLFQPRRYGGYEADPIDFFEIQRELSAACPSTGWTWGVLSAHAWQLSLFPQQAQDDVWARSATALIASSYAPGGKRVEAVDGGYRVSGKWDFCSGIDHAEWCFLGGFVAGKRPEFRTFLVSKTDYVVEDHWHVSGLQGTGSKTVVVDNAFVPGHRTHRMQDAFHTRSPGNAINTSLLYKLPFGQVFVRSISTPVLGMATGALDIYLTLMKSKVSTVSGARAKDDPRVLETLAQGRSEVEMLNLKMRANFEEMWQYVRAGREIPLERRVQFKYESADTVRRCCELLDEMIASAGTKAIFRSNSLALFHADALAARAHFGNNVPFFAQNFGGVLMGSDLSDIFL
jgi:3-hydroxy-9,10-secoandrosta-1,3,5(10)-triene-9,17-dione monooxygenase